MKMKTNSLFIIKRLYKRKSNNGVLENIYFYLVKDKNLNGLYHVQIKNNKIIINSAEIGYIQRFFECEIEVLNNGVVVAFRIYLVVKILFYCSLLLSLIGGPILIILSSIFNISKWLGYVVFVLGFIQCLLIYIGFRLSTNELNLRVSKAIKWVTSSRSVESPDSALEK
jgi:hypothetical protein